MVGGGAVQHWLWFQMSPQMIFSTLPFIEMLLRQLWWLVGGTGGFFEMMSGQLWCAALVAWQHWWRQLVNGSDSDCAPLLQQTSPPAGGA